jgi:hypothetical protein
MKATVRIALVIAGLLTLWLGPLIWASRSGEVVILTTTDASGATEKTPLWIVDHGGFSWLRAGSDRAAWLARIRSYPRIEIERAGKTTAYRGTLVPEATGDINAQMIEKYGLADRVVGLLLPGSRRKSLAVRLDSDSPQ